jgi:HD-like signal output (HDOD) protein
MAAQRPVRLSISSRTVVQAARSLRLLGAAAGTAAKLVAHLCNSGMSADDLSLRIESDPVLCARVLRVANAAYYGQQRSVTTIRRALLVLGLNTVRGVAAAACIDQAIPSRLAALPDPAALGRHGLATALAAEMLAMGEIPEMATEAFIAGLLHNLGVVIQSQVDPDGMAQMIAARRAGDTRDIRTLEEEHAAISHGQAASIVFEEWKLPAAFIAAAEHHHDSSAAPESARPLTDIVSRAASLALACGQVYSLEPTCPVTGPDGPLESTQLGPAAFRDELSRRLEHLTTALA